MVSNEEDAYKINEQVYKELYCHTRYKFTRFRAALAAFYNKRSDIHNNSLQVIEKGGTVVIVYKVLVLLAFLLDRLGLRFRRRI